MRNIILIGMPGVGKSTVGVMLAKILGCGFVDSDLKIQEEEGRLLKQIIDQEGVEAFMEIENRVNSRLNEEHSVIATGGSVVYGKQAMQNLSRLGTVVYLRLGYPSLSKRLSDLRGRGVVLKAGQDLNALYQERCPLYEKYADLIVDEEGLDMEATLQAVLETLESV